MRDAALTMELGWKGESQVRRANNRESSAAILAERGVAHESKNGGAHLIVSHAGKVAYFWPGTGKWIVRSGKAGRGVFPLLSELGHE